MINNRQNGRRRGRGGGQRPPNNAPNSGNRQDNRQRGNAAQLHEKYKALARDAQLSGDRVQTENYLQYADHYFRVLNEGRARFEEQRRQPGDDEDQDEANPAHEGEDRDDRDSRFGNASSFRNGGDRDRDDGRSQRPPQQAEANEADQDQDQDRDREEDDERISLDVLPPAIATEDSEAPRVPRRRTRRPRPDSDTEIAPAA